MLPPQVLVVEATRMRSDGGPAAAKGWGRLTLTGQLGEVMRESAALALSWIRSRWTDLADSDGDFLSGYDVHVHFPAGAVGKDGPSAGLAVLVALVSLFSGVRVRDGNSVLLSYLLPYILLKIKYVDCFKIKVKVRTIFLPLPDLALTGEVTLRGLVLPVGGVREKCLAAYREGVGRVAVPAGNADDLDSVPAAVRARLGLHPVATVEEALGVAFGGDAPDPGLLLRGLLGRPPPLVADSDRTQAKL